MREKIKLWIKEGSHPESGVVLMGEAGASPYIISMLKKNPREHADFIRRWLARYAGTAISSSSEQRLSFRDEFPFLSESSCPVELQILATRKISAYHSYVDAHARLRDCTTLAQMAEQSRCVIESYLENQSIYAELNYYKNHKVVLGKHPIFAEYRRRRSLNGMSVKELILRQRQIEQNIWRVKDEIKKNTKPHLLMQRKERLRAYEEELADINRMLA